MAEKIAEQDIQHTAVTAVILAGGAGVRAGRRDKGTIEWMGRPLIAHVHERVAPQVGKVLISCNRNADFYAAYAEQTFPDLRADYQGPLAGLEAASSQTDSQLILFAPCDTPQLPRDLVARLMQPLSDSASCDGSYAHSGEHNHYLCALLRRRCLDSLPAYLDAGGRAVRHWYHQHEIVAVDFGAETGAFQNINRPDQDEPVLTDWA